LKGPLLCSPITKCRLMKSHSGRHNHPLGPRQERAWRAPVLGLLRGAYRLRSRCNRESAPMPN